MQVAVELVGDATPRAPLSNQIAMGELFPSDKHEIIITPGDRKKVKVDALVAGGGMAGSALFRYLAEAGLKPVLANYSRGSSWRNIAGGRPNFSVPELSEIARQNRIYFKELQSMKSIDYRTIDYVTFAHDEETYKALEASIAWSGGKMISPDKYAIRDCPRDKSKT